VALCVYIYLSSSPFFSHIRPKIMVPCAGLYRTCCSLPVRRCCLRRYQGMANRPIETSRRLAPVVAHPPIHIDLLVGQSDGAAGRRSRVIGVGVAALAGQGCHSTLWLWSCASTASCPTMCVKRNTFRYGPLRSPSLSSRSPHISDSFSQGIDVFARGDDAKRAMEHAREKTKRRGEGSG
jgi:hypothetical protein